MQLDYSPYKNYSFKVIYLIKARVEGESPSNNFIWDTYLHRLRNEEVKNPRHEIRPNLNEDESPQITVHLQQLIEDEGLDLKIRDIRIHKETTVSYDDTDGLHWTGHKKKLIKDFCLKTSEPLIWKGRVRSYLPSSFKPPVKTKVEETC